MRKTYIIKNIEQSNIELNSNLWSLAEKAEIACINWPEWDYKPNTSAYILSGKEGITVKFITDETPYVQYHSYNDPVNNDSCVELFLNPSPENDSRYMNFEINAEGVLHLGIRKGRKDGSHVENIDAGIFDIQSETTQEGWQVKLFIPFSFLNKYYERISDTFAANMYKCGDMTPRPHFVTWSPINTDKPDFHRPEWFGRMERK